MKTPPPGSPEAEELGCKCPRLDNAHGHGYMGQQGIYVYSGACELHSPEMRQKEQEIDERNHNE